MIYIGLDGVHGRGKHAIVDDEDAYMLAFRWCVTKNGYVYRHLGNQYAQRGIMMHHEVMEYIGTLDHPVDHRNQNKLDNRRSNLRVTTPKKNLLNRPVYSNSTTGVRYVYENVRRIGSFVAKPPGLPQRTFDHLEDAAVYAATSKRT